MTLIKTQETYTEDTYNPSNKHTYCTQAVKIMTSTPTAAAVRFHTHVSLLATHLVCSPIQYIPQESN